MNSPGPSFDAFDSRINEHPYPHYDRLRTDAPVYWEPALRAWVLTRHEDIKAVLEDDERFDVISVASAIERFASRAGRDYSGLVRIIAAVTFFQSGEEHRIGRRSMSKAFTRIPIRDLAPLVEGIARELTGALRRRERFDAAADYAIPLPLRVIAHIVGVPAEVAQRLYAIGNDVTLAFDVVSPTTYARLEHNSRAILDSMTQLMRAAVAAGTDHPLAYFHEESMLDGEARIHDAAARAFFALLVAMVTTSSLIAFAIERLLSDPGLYARARADASLVNPIMEEMLRLESPVQRVLRTARKDCVIGGTAIRRGERLLLLLGAANRDPSLFPEPVRLDTARAGPPHIAFGAGRHVCVGAAIARLEADIALRHFLELPVTAPADGPRVIHPSLTVRRLVRLPVRFSAAGEGQ